jgi:putative N6-adenine-specific DNA methylase
MNQSELKRIFISCAPGLEPYLKRECMQIGINLAKSNGKPTAEIGIHGTEEEKGGIEFQGTDHHVYLCNLHLRTASRVIVRLGEFYAAAFSELRKKAGRLDWEQYVKPGQDVEIKVTCHKSKLYHSDAVAERIRGAIEDHLHQPIAASGKEPTKPIVIVRLVNDLCTISIDSSGELLHRRGYRQAVAKAPLRETLAAGLLLSAGWESSQPLIDPFCGSGTIPIEAALMARNIAPGINRHFAFMDWAGYQSIHFKELLEIARKAIKASASMIYASDRDRGAVDMATANAARTGVHQNIQFACHAISDLPSHKGPGWIITNPPYGVRVSSSKDLRNLYSSFGKLLREDYAGWNLGILCSDEQLIHALELGQPEYSLPLINGGIAVKFSIFKSF